MPNGGYLTAEQVLAADDLKTADVSVPEWGGTIRVRAMGTEELAEYRNRTVGTARSKVKELGDVDVEMILFQSSHWLVGRCAIDALGHRLFTEAQAEQLAHKSPAANDRVAKKILDLTAMTQEGADEIAGESDAEAEPATI